MEGCGFLLGKASSSYHRSRAEIHQQRGLGHRKTDARIAQDATAEGDGGDGIQGQCSIVNIRYHYYLGVYHIFQVKEHNVEFYFQQSQKG